MMALFLVTLLVVQAHAQSDDFTEEWHRSWPTVPTASGEDRAYAAVADQYGTVFVTGSTWGTKTNRDMAVWVYDKNGTLLATLIHDNAAGGNGDDVANAIALGADGSVYTAGYSKGPTGNGNDMVVWKLIWIPSPAGLTLDTAFGMDASGNPNGAGFTVRNDGKSGTYDDIGRSLVLDGNGDVLVAGSVYGLSGNLIDMAVWKLKAANGELDSNFSGGLFTHHNAAGGNHNDEGWAIVADDVDNTYIAGRSRNAEGNYDAIVWKLTPIGLLDENFASGVGWAQYASSSGAKADEARAITIKGMGSLFVAGRSNGVGTSDWDMVLWKFTADGLLDQNFGTGGLVFSHGAAGGNGQDWANGIAIDCDSVYVTGTSYGGANGFDMAIWKYAKADGALLRTQTFHNAAGGGSNDVGTGIALLMSGAVYVAGNSVGPTPHADDMAVWKLLHQNLGYCVGDVIAYGVASQANVTGPGWIDSDGTLYAVNAKSDSGDQNIFWPSGPLLGAQTKWPTEHDTITIANGLGSVLPSGVDGDPANTVHGLDAEIFNVNGLNLNEEQGFVYLTGDGIDPVADPLSNKRVYALRARPDVADPADAGDGEGWVLLKYRQRGLRKFKCYKVLKGDLSRDVKVGDVLDPVYPLDKILYGDPRYNRPNLMLNPSAQYTCLTPAPIAGKAWIDGTIIANDPSYRRVYAVNKDNTISVTWRIFWYGSDACDPNPWYAQAYRATWPDEPPSPRPFRTLDITTQHGLDVDDPSGPYARYDYSDPAIKPIFGDGSNHDCNPAIQSNLYSNDEWCLNPNDENAVLLGPFNYQKLYATRDGTSTNDNGYSNPVLSLSDPWILLRYRDALDGDKIKYEPIKVQTVNLAAQNVDMQVGTLIQPPFPLNFPGRSCSGSHILAALSTPNVYWQDHKGSWWPKRDGTIKIHWVEKYFGKYGDSCLNWLGHNQAEDSNWTITAGWPSAEQSIDNPTGYTLMHIGESRDRSGQCSVELLYNSAGATLLNNANESQALITGAGITKTISLGDRATVQQGWVTLGLQGDGSCNFLPVSVEVIKAECPPYKGSIIVEYPYGVGQWTQDKEKACPFDEAVRLRFSGDCGGDPTCTGLYFEWQYTDSPEDPNSWKPDGDAVNPHGPIFTISGPGIATITDRFYRLRYNGYDLACPGQWSEWTDPQLKEGWLKRVALAFNVVDFRLNAFHTGADQSYVNALAQAGPRYEDTVAMNCDPANLNSIGLIEILHQVLARGRSLSIDAGDPGIDYPSANQALLLAASKLAKLYMLLGNEAYADALDPTIGTEGSVDPAVMYSFQNQYDVPSLLDEELALLRGLKLTSPEPVYNRLRWNCTGDTGQAAYISNYNITNLQPTGATPLVKAQTNYPQGHGDAWGHFLTATRYYYSLLNDESFDWIDTTEHVDVGGVPVKVDYSYTRAFAQAAAAKSRAGKDIVALTFRKQYTDNPAQQLQNYTDTSSDKWGVYDWATRAGMAAYLDWALGSALAPATTPPTAPAVELVRAYAFGADFYSRKSDNDLNVKYTKVMQPQDPKARGSYYLSINGGDGYVDLQSVDTTPNKANVFTGNDGLYDQHIGVRDDGYIRYRINLPIGKYRFVAAGGYSAPAGPAGVDRPLSEDLARIDFGPTTSGILQPDWDVVDKAQIGSQMTLTHHNPDDPDLALTVTADRPDNVLEESQGNGFGPLTGVFADGLTIRNGGTWTLTFNGVPNGTYDLTIYASSPQGFDTRVTSPQGTTLSLTADQAPLNPPTTPPQIQATMSVTVTNGALVVTVKSQPDNPASSPDVSGVPEPRLSGLKLIRPSHTSTLWVYVPTKTGVNHVQLLPATVHRSGDYWRVGFDNKHAPAADGVNPDPVFLPEVTSPTITLNANVDRTSGLATPTGYIEIVQQAAGRFGGDLCLLEIWDVTESDPNQVFARKDVPELKEIAANLTEIQEQIGLVDAGLNPLGLVRNVVPFQVSSAQLDAGKTQFEQTYDRALKMLTNTKAVLDFANSEGKRLRDQQDQLVQFDNTVTNQEADFKSRLIEIFGYPYPDDPSYTDYNQPDIYHYDYVRSYKIAGSDPPPIEERQVTLVDTNVNQDGSISKSNRVVTYHIAKDGTGLLTPGDWTGERQAPGEIQLAKSELIQAQGRVNEALAAIDDLNARIQEQAQKLQAYYNLSDQDIDIRNDASGKRRTLNNWILGLNATSQLLHLSANNVRALATAQAEGLPKELGLSNDTTSIARAAFLISGNVAANVIDVVAIATSTAELRFQQNKEDLEALTQLKLISAQADLTKLIEAQELQKLARQVPVLSIQAENANEAANQAMGRYRQAIARGLRLLEDRDRIRQQTADRVRDYRYKDLAYRTFKSEWLQKYRAQFDVAARYVYLAAKAFDYETNLLGSGADSFLDRVTRARTLGTQLPDGTPQGPHGLAGVLADLNTSFDQISANLDFENPRREQRRFSLRRELLRIKSTDNTRWRDTLQTYVVPDLRQQRDIMRLSTISGIFSDQTTPQPGIVIRFSTMIQPQMNFFGWPSDSGDLTYPTDRFTTKIRRAGVWFSNYNHSGDSGGMVTTPSIYLIPAGEFVMRVPQTGCPGTIRSWQVLDQVMPMPITLQNLGSSGNDWRPWEANFKLAGTSPPDTTFGLQKPISAIVGWPDDVFIFDPDDPDSLVTDPTLLARTVWNTEWILVIPGASLRGADPADGVQRFIYGKLVNGVYDNNGVTDILLLFDTYAYPSACNSAAMLTTQESTEKSK